MRSLNIKNYYVIITHNINKLKTIIQNQIIKNICKKSSCRENEK